ncbi:serine hydrolase [Xanthocytophaga agilis]|uniref:Serine hydrolase n=1 Tax=Xanthocytophaga agilis TaxID=3048010 RepID=A0AAE3UH76_9BACT|nr:serine hydrolase [Xanthocytophaga agilis]MDJ1503147.1 serine hydrolase [Xanthocytophaga agilis]
MKRLLPLLFYLFSPLLFAQTAKQLNEFDAYIQKAVKEWQIPGLAIAVVKDGKVILKKGYGTREVGKDQLVDVHTLFACASTTKALTATGMGMLVDAGKVSWNDPVIKYLPDFHLYDPYVTKQLTVRDLFTHNSGVGNTDFLWGDTDWSSEEVLQKMAMVKPSYSFRASFIYQNIFYLVAGKVIEKVSGMSWGEFMKQRIFQPLGMTRTKPYFKEVTDANRSRPHFKVENTIVAIEDLKADAIGPAGSVWSCVDDMAKWVACMLDSSKYTGGRLVNPQTWTELFKPQVMVPPSQFYPTMRLTQPNWTTYGLGWFQQDYKGKKVNFHTGSLPGTIAIHGQLPEAKLGIYILGNYDHAEIRHALMFKAFDLFALGGNRDWSAEFLTLYQNLAEAAKTAEKEFESSRKLNTQPSFPLEAYTGKYSDPLYGDVVITLANNQLSVTINKFVKITVEHWHYNTFRGWYEKKWYGKDTINFILSADGTIEKVVIDGKGYQKEVPEKKL